MNIKELKLPLLKRIKVAEDTYEIRLAFPKKEGFDYLPGQYITIRLEEKIKDGKGPLRAFSLSSSPTNKEYLSTCFRISKEPSIFKEKIMKLKLNTLLILRGPLGRFSLPKEKNRKVVMIAGGVGITPFMSMLTFLTETSDAQKVTLIYTNKTEESRAYKKELKDLEIKNKNLKVINRNKRVDKIFLEKYAQDKNSLFYICGTPQMVVSIKMFLQDLGIREENILFEKFSGY